MASVVKSCRSVEACLLDSEHSCEQLSPRPPTLDVCGYEVEEDDGSPQLKSIWQQMQANRKADMLLLSRVFRRGRDETISVC